MNKAITYPSFHIMAKPNGPLCNLNCRYCFYLEKERLYPDRSDFLMNDSVLESFIKQKMETDQSGTVNFAWQGGEPTLSGVEFFRKAIELQNKYSDGRKIENTLQTNGVLLNDEWCDYFAENSFLIGVSVDGPEYIHDKYRVSLGNKPTFSRVMKGIECLKRHGVEFNTLTVVQKDNAYHPLEVYNFLKETGSGFMQFIPIVERVSSQPGDDGIALVSPDYKGEAQLTDWSVEPEQFGDFLIGIFNEWVLKDVGKYFVQIFDVSLESWLGLNPGLCIFRDRCGSAMALEHNGDLYSCDHYVYRHNRLGNIMESPLELLVNSPKQVRFGLDKKDLLPEYCLRCDVKFACNGECPKHRFLTTPEGEPGLNYLCAGYKKFFRHIDPYLKFMANELVHKRPPANVMKWAEEKTKGFPSLNPGRNDQCPCGSGQKYKKCCGAE